MNFNNELNNWQQIPREVVNDTSLSMEARFIYVYMACKPDGWDYYQEAICREIGKSKHTYLKYEKELINAGWLVKHQQSVGADGRFGNCQYTLKASRNMPDDFSHYNEMASIIDETVDRFYNTDNHTECNNLHTVPSANSAHYIIDNDIDIDKKKNIKKSIRFVCPDIRYQDCVNRWLEYKKSRRQSYASVKTIEILYNRLVSLSNGVPSVAEEIINQSIANNWAGIFQLKDSYNHATTTNAMQQAASVISGFSEDDFKLAD